MIRRALLSLLLGASVFGVALPKAHAWNPYTHVFTGELAHATLTTDAKGQPCLLMAVTNNCYPLANGLGAAIVANPSVFRGGIIGPDGFPDVIMGQTVIHPLDNHDLTTFDPTRVGTGRWLRYLIQKARASGDPKALAFSYGYLTHAAGDMWGHTFVNDFARGVFPSIKQTLLELANPTDPANFALGVEHLANSIRHELTELYIRDATPGWDGDPDITPARYGECENNDTPDDNGCCPASDPFCHVSDNATEPVDLGKADDYPVDFIFQTLVDPNAPSPSNRRGALLEFFISLQQWLRQHENVDVTKPFQDAANDFNNLAPLAAQWQEDCIDDNDGGSPEASGFPGADVVDALADAGECAATTVEITAVAGFDVAAAGFTLATEITATALELLAAAYLKAWDDDITDGLHHWAEFGLATSESFFDPGTRRQWQFENCRQFDTGGPNEIMRDNCLRGFGIFDTLMANDDYLNFRDHHLFSMLGLPDFVGDLDATLRQIVDSKLFRAVKDGIEDFTPLAAGLKDLVWVSDQIQAFIQHLIEQEIKDYFHIDINIQAVKDMFNYPDAWLAVGDLGDTITQELFGFNANLSLFRPSDHPTIDTLVGFPADHHVPAALPIPGFPAEALRLSDTAEIQRPMFAAYENTIMMSQLLLLDGDGLNSLLGDVLFAAGWINDAGEVQTYRNHADSNVMFDTLTPDAGALNSIPDEPWLLSIDSDHAWRKDPLPAFCTGTDNNDTGDPDKCGIAPANTPQRQAWLNGGNGHFPIWESCLLRPAFRAMFTDWQDPGSPTGFPDNGDDPSADPSDSAAPTAAVTITGDFVGTLNGSPTTFVNGASQISVTATDQVFTPAHVNFQFQTFKDGSSPPGFTLGIGNTGSFNISSTDDGFWTVEVQTQDPCHTFAVEAGEGTTGVDALPPGDSTTSVVLDTTPPVITVSSPVAGQLYTTSSVIVLSFGADDGPLGSGVASTTATLDGAAVVNGQTIDLFNFTSGTHNLVVTSVDNLGNTSSVTRPFRVRATPASVLSNFDRAFVAGLITSRQLDKAVHDELVKAGNFASQGNLGGEGGQLNAALHQLMAARANQCNGGPVTAPCFQIDPATADRLIVDVAELSATDDFTDAEYLSDPPALQILEGLDHAYLAGKLSIQLYATFIDSAIQAVSMAHRQILSAAEDLLFDVYGKLLAALNAPCHVGPGSPTCPLEDAPTARQLIVGIAELAAVINLPPAALPVVQPLRNLLAEVDGDFTTGLITSSDFYDSLVRELTSAIAAEAAGRHLEAQQDVQGVVQIVESALAHECRNTPTASCFSVDVTAGGKLDTDAKAVLATL
jgi:hypothetical protein